MLAQISTQTEDADLWQRLGGLIGSVVASTLNHGISQRLLERSFAVLLVILAVWMAIETIFLGH